MNKKLMVSFIGVVIASLAVAGCTTTTTQSSPTVTAMSTVVAGQVSAVKIASLPMVPDNSSLTGVRYPQTGNTFVSFNVTGTTTISDWNLQTRGRSYSVIASAVPIDDNGNPVFNPSWQHITFEVPKNATSATLAYNGAAILSETQLT